MLSVTSARPFRDCSCQRVSDHRSARSVDAPQLKALQEDLRANFLIFSHRFQLLVLELVIVCTRCGNFAEHLEVSAVANSKYRSTHFYKVFPSYDFARTFAPHFLQSSSSSVAPPEIRGSNFLFSSTKLVRLTFTLSVSQVNLIQKLRWFLKIVSSIFSIWIPAFACSLPS